LVRGKDKGLLFLLHGVPGVGKTATAVAVAQKWQKPLFPITCGDLGITIDSVEAALSQIFRLAHLWDCVLLLDEAEVFIAQRAKVGDLARNGLVSGESRTWDVGNKY
jgi:SpoVK/Ycf46/Vps4 family AAA+-type ATPase